MVERDAVGLPRDADTRVEFLQRTRFDAAFGKLPWAKDTTERSEAERDPARNPFAQAMT